MAHPCRQSMSFFPVTLTQHRRSASDCTSTPLRLSRLARLGLHKIREDMHSEPFFQDNFGLRVRRRALQSCGGAGASGSGVIDPGEGGTRRRGSQMPILRHHAPNLPSLSFVEKRRGGPAVQAILQARWSMCLTDSMAPINYLLGYLYALR